MRIVTAMFCEQGPEVFYKGSPQRSLSSLLVRQEEPSHRVWAVRWQKRRESDSARPRFPGVQALSFSSGIFGGVKRNRKREKQPGRLDTWTPPQDQRSAAAICRLGLRSLGACLSAVYFPSMVTAAIAQMPVRH